MEVILLLVFVRYISSISGRGGGGDMLHMRNFALEGKWLIRDFVNHTKVAY